MKRCIPSGSAIALLLCLPANAQKKAAASSMELGRPGSGQPSERGDRDPGQGQGRTVQGLRHSRGGAPGLQLARVGDSGEWGGRIDTTLVPNGERQLKVVTENRRATLVVPVRVGNPLRHFFADLHSHTSFSDGSLLPEVAHDYARDVAKLDVFCLTDHLESVDDTEWGLTRQAAWGANEDGKFVSFPGLEWIKKWGHIQHLRPWDPAMAEGP